VIRGNKGGGTPGLPQPGGKNLQWGKGENREVTPQSQTKSHETGRGVKKPEGIPSGASECGNESGLERKILIEVRFYLPLKIKGC